MPDLVRHDGLELAGIHYLEGGVRDQHHEPRVNRDVRLGIVDHFEDVSAVSSMRA